MYELFKLLEGFFKNNKSLVISSIGFQIIYSVLESIIIPFILADAFNNIGNFEIFRNDLIKLVCLWIVVKTVGSISLHYHSKIEPEISKYIVVTIIEYVFNKYENENHVTNVSLLIDKIHLIKSNLHDFSHLLFTVFTPRIIVLILSCINFFIISPELGLIITFSVIVQYLIITSGHSNCINRTFDEHKTKDKMYEYIEDLFSNISTIQSTIDGYDFEIKNLSTMTSNVKNKENNTLNCINKKQYFGYGTNIMIFSFIIYNIYRMYKSNKLTKEKTTTCILLVLGLFENMSDMSYYIPEFTYRFGILKSNESFLKELVLSSELNKNNLDCLTCSNIDFDNVTFKYPKSDNYLLTNFKISIPENKIITVFGKSGLGKTTFTKLIFGIENPTEGNIFIGGKNIKDYNKSDIRKYISYIEQNTSNLFNRSIFENITYGMKFSSKNEEENVKDKIKYILIYFGLYDIFKNLDKDRYEWYFLDQNAGKLGSKLSGGQKKVIHLLRLCLNDFSKIIILDEPSNGLDINTRNSIISFINYLKMKNKTIIIVTHDDYFKNISDKVLEFNSNENPKYIF